MKDYWPALIQRIAQLQAEEGNTPLSPESLIGLVRTLGKYDFRPPSLTLSFKGDLRAAWRSPEGGLFGLEFLSASHARWVYLPENGAGSTGVWDIAAPPWRTLPEGSLRLMLLEERLR